MKIYLLTLLLALSACASDPLTSTYRMCKATDAAVQATDVAMLQGRISKADAQKAFLGLAASASGCNAAVAALSASAPASAAK